MSVETFLKAHRDRVSPECIFRPSPTCALCRNPTDHLVQAREDWCTALLVAEKHITQRVQPLVRSPILTSYARGAYHLRQKPCGWCCTSCCDWVRKQSEAQQLLVEPSWGPIPGVWPQLGEAAITGARFFPVDFEEETPGHDESANMGIPLPLKTRAPLTEHGTPVGRAVDPKANGDLPERSTENPKTAVTQAASRAALARAAGDLQGSNQASPLVTLS